MLGDLVDGRQAVARVRMPRRPRHRPRVVGLAPARDHHDRRDDGRQRYAEQDAEDELKARLVGRVRLAAGGVGLGRIVVVGVDRN